MKDMPIDQAKVHQIAPSRDLTISVASSLAETPFSLCGKCIVRGVAFALQDMLRAAEEADSEFGEALKNEVLTIVKGEALTLVKGSETPQ